jgi:quinol monooxygenase YgiN
MNLLSQRGEWSMNRFLWLLGCAGVAFCLTVPSGHSGGDKKNPILEAARENVSDPKKPFTMVVMVKVQEGQGKSFEKLFQPAIQATRKEKGCIAYDLNRDLKDATKYYVYERWKSIAALEQHMETEHIKTLLSKLPEVLAGPPEAMFFAVAGE